MATAERLIYDPMAAFADVFSNPRLAADLGFALNCREVNVLVGLLEYCGRPDAAAQWLTRHRDDCDHPLHH